jgi:hypothetical protein
MVVTCDFSSSKYGDFLQLFSKNKNPCIICTGFILAATVQKFTQKKTWIESLTENEICDIEKLGEFSKKIAKLVVCKYI